MPATLNLDGQVCARQSDPSHPCLDPRHRAPLSNLYLSMLQRLGIETDKFASSTGTLMGLEVVG